MNQLFCRLNSALAFRWLWPIALGFQIIYFIQGGLHVNSDQFSYVEMARGILKGNFSSWHNAPFDAPENLRNWGYPFFLSISLFFSDNLWLPKVMQFILFISMGFSGVILIGKKDEKSFLRRNLFLILLIASPQIAYYQGLLIAEGVVISLVIAIAVLHLSQKESIKKYLMLAMLCYCIYAMRPVYLFLPFLYATYFGVSKKIRWRYLGIYCLAFIIMLMPYAAWNKKNHGVFSITPIDGAAALNLYVGYWLFKLPDGQTMYDPVMARVRGDLLRPNFYSEKEKAQFAEDFIKEQKMIYAESFAQLSDGDKSKIEYMINHAGDKNLFLNYPLKFVLKDKEITIKTVVDHIMEDPMYYIKTRLYMLFRMWVSGVDSNKYANCEKTSCISLLYPAITTFSIILLGFIFVSFKALQCGVFRRRYELLFMIIVYHAVFALPFSIQARYTVPVHALILFLIASVVTSSRLIQNKLIEIKFK
jgi:hypothetical protein